MEAARGRIIRIPSLSKPSTSVMARFAFVLWCLVSFFLATGCQTDDVPSTSSEQLEVPAEPGSAQPHLHATEDGTVWMSWVAPTGEEEHALRYASFDRGEWSTPETVASGTDWFVNWADVPSVRPLPDGRHAAHYLVSNGPGVFAYGVRIAQTSAEGEWQDAVRPHRDASETEHGFVSLLPWAEDRLLAVWLDGRKMAGQGEGHQGEMTLRGGLLDASGTVQQRTLLDDRTCECCPTSAVRTASGALVAYRDRTEEEIRNIRLVRFDGETWSEPYLLHDDGWNIEGCPVNGPALAARGTQSTAAWFTAAEGAPRVRVAFSDDGGRQFSDPVEVAEGTPKGRVDVVVLDDGSAVVSWLGQEQERAVIKGRHVAPDGTLGEPVPLAVLPSTSRDVGMPRMVRSGDQLYVAWVGTEEETSQVRLARMPVQTLRSRSSL